MARDFFIEQRIEGKSRLAFVNRDGGRASNAAFEELTTTVSSLVVPRNIDLTLLMNLVTDLYTSGGIGAQKLTTFAAVYNQGISPIWDTFPIINTEGLDSDITPEGSIHTYTVSVDDSGLLDDYEKKLVSELGLNAVGFQYELLPDTNQLRSGNQHYSLGKISSEGIFEPIVTVIDDNHPSVQYRKGS